MSITQKIVDLNRADLSQLADRLRALSIPAPSAQAAPSATATPATVDEAWVRRYVVPVLTKMTRLTT